MELKPETKRKINLLEALKFKGNEHGLIIKYVTMQDLKYATFWDRLKICTRLFLGKTIPVTHESKWVDPEEIAKIEAYVISD
jgi:hypothetical protein